MNNNPYKKLLTIGDTQVGKTALLFSYTRGQIPDWDGYLPSQFDSYVETINVDGKEIEFALWDRVAREEFADLYKKLEPIPYNDTDVILICYSVDNFGSFQNVLERWEPDATKFCPNVPVILVGNKADLRNNDSSMEDFVSKKEGEEMAAKINAFAFFECSAKTNDGVNEVFKTAASASLKYNDKRLRKKCCII